jgi:hypothetical protein
MMTIICKTCERELAPSSFYNNKRDGRLQPCKECWKAKYKKSEAGKAANRLGKGRWKKTETGKASNRRAVARWQAKPENKARRCEWKESHPDNVRRHFTKWNRRQQHLRKVAKALATIALEALDAEKPQR